MTTPKRRCDREAGSATLELAVLAPGLLLFIAAAIIVGRVSLAGGAVEEAARDAARRASIARSAETGRYDAYTAARQTLAHQGLQCTRLVVHVDTAGFAVPVGQPASVSATVACTVRLSDIAAPGLPGDRTVTATFTSTLDTYRERTLGFANPESPSGMTVNREASR